MDKREIAVDAGMMYDNVREMQNALTQLKEEIERLFLEMEEFTGMWDNPSCEEFLKHFEQDKQKMLEFESAAEKLTECMQDAVREYQSCENAVFSIVRTIQI